MLKLLTPPVSRAAAVAACTAAGVLAAFAATAPHRVAAAVQTGDCSPYSSWPAADGSLASQVLSLINQHRASLGEGQLATSSTLTASAVWKARHMAAYNYFSHDDPGPPTAPTPARTAADRVATCGYPYSFGENIAEGYTSAQAVVTAWLNSAGHKANIENASFVVTGVGVATSSSGVVFWVQDFGTVADGGSPPPTTTTQPPPPPPPPPSTTTQQTTTQQTTTQQTTTAATTTTRPAAGTTTTTPAVSTPTLASIHLQRVKIRVRSARLVLSTRVSAAGQGPATAGVKCDARVGKRTLRVVVNAYQAHLARCAWRLPHRLTAHAVVRGWVSIREGPAHVRRSFRFRLGR